MFFQSHHSRDREYFSIDASVSDKGYPLHMHRAFECYAVMHGRAAAIIDGKEYSMEAGDAVLVFPYQKHEYRTERDTDTWVCIFSPDLVGSFDKRRKLTPVSNKFPLSPDGDLPQSLLMKKSLCYRICALFDQGAEYTEKSAEKDDLLTKILNYIGGNYKEECSLDSLARHVGYDYSYISKFFKRMTGQSYKSYLNGLRIGEACRLLRESDSPVSEIAEATGFATVRTFNREFSRITGKTPGEYRKSC